MNTKIALKGLIIIGLTLLLLIPAFFINNLVNERQTRQADAFKEISSKWAETQTIAGPILTIPYFEVKKDSTEKEVFRYKRYIHILPDQLNIEGNMNPEKRYRGLFEIVVYSSKLTFSGTFSNIVTQNLHVPKENILFDQAFISVGISDLRGIKESVTLVWNRQIKNFNSGIETNDIFKTAISTPISISKNDTSGEMYNFQFNLSLKGSQYLYFTPIGKETDVTISSNWKEPSFDGAFLPDNRIINSNGFKGDWKILQLNRNYPQSWLNSNYSIDNSAFGINLLLAVDSYTRTDRSIKYAVLIIVLTFLIFYFLELLNGKSVHPLQYILIGFALCVFYILLLSISEHTNYNLSYLIAAVMTIGLIWWYSNSILGEKKLAALVGGNLILLYSFIFTIIQLQDYALLMGSFGLFIILAMVMYYSRKIDWKSLRSE